MTMSGGVPAATAVGYFWKKRSHGMPCDSKQASGLAFGVLLEHFGEDGAIGPGQAVPQRQGVVALAEGIDDRGRLRGGGIGIDGGFRRGVCCWCRWRRCRRRAQQVLLRRRRRRAASPLPLARQILRTAFA